MRKIICIFILLFGFITVNAQQNYYDSMTKFRQQYIDSHEVVTGAEKAKFQFYKIKPDYRVRAKFERIDDSKGFIMKTSGKESKKYYKYGLLRFSLKNKPLHLTIYQSDQLMRNEEYKDYLFVPYTDETSGEESYGGGRYLDFKMSEIINNELVIDFNKAYNPYCAYAEGYNCPIPPRENDLPVSIKAGEKYFSKKH